MRRGRIVCPTCGGKTKVESIDQRVIKFNGEDFVVEGDCSARVCTECDKVVLTIKDHNRIKKLLTEYLE